MRHVDLTERAAPLRVQARRERDDHERVCGAVFVAIQNPQSSARSHTCSER